VWQEVCVRILGCLVLIGLGACSEPRVDDILALTGSAEDGAVVYADSCAVCHGADGTGDLGSDLTSVIPSMDDDEIISVLLNGLEGTTMPSFAEALDNQAIADVVAHVTSGF
jgi:mono/diheme cytochrome c family protein